MCLQIEYLVFKKTHCVFSKDLSVKRDCHAFYELNTQYVFHRIQSKHIINMPFKIPTNCGNVQKISF